MTKVLTNQAPNRTDAVAPDVGEAPPAAERRPPRRRHLYPWLWALAAIAIGAGGTWWWRTRAPERVTYTTAPIDRGAVSRSITASGSVNPVLTVIVGTYVSGVIRDISCDYNTRVRKGQVCAMIDPRPYQLIVEQNRAALETAKAQLAKDQANLRYAEANLQRNAKLVQGGWVSPDTADSVRAIRDQATAQVGVDRATILQRQAALDAAEVNLSYTRIVSPVDGTVVSRNVTIGQTVAASFQTPTLFLIAQDLTKMQVDTNVSESDIEAEAHGLEAGDRATFTVEAFPRRPFHGVVRQIRQAPQTVQNVVTYDVVIAVDNPDLKLRPGMTATVRIVTEARNDAVRAPNAAMRFNPGGLGAAGQGARSAAGSLDQVWVLRDGKPAAVRVRPGLVGDTYTELAESSLQPGDRVITGELGKSREANRATPPGPRLPRF